MATDSKHEFRVHIARVDEGGRQLLQLAPEWPNDTMDYDLLSYVEHVPPGLMSLRKIAGRCRSTLVGEADKEVAGPCVEAAVEYRGSRLRLCGELPDLKANKAGERIRADMDMILVFRDDEPGGRPAHVELIVQGDPVASTSLHR